MSSIVAPAPFIVVTRILSDVIKGRPYLFNYIEIDLSVLYDQTIEITKIMKIRQIHFFK